MSTSPYCCPGLHLMPFMPLGPQRFVDYMLRDCMDPGLLTDGQMT